MEFLLHFHHTNYHFKFECYNYIYKIHIWPLLVRTSQYSISFLAEMYPILIFRIQKVSLNHAGFYNELFRYSWHICVKDACSRHNSMNKGAVRCFTVSLAVNLSLSVYCVGITLCADLQVFYSACCWKQGSDNFR